MLRSTWFTDDARSKRESTSVPSRSNATCANATRGAVGTAPSGRERRAAATRLCGLGIRELEPAAVQAADEVDLGALEVLRAGGVDPHREAVEPPLEVALLALTIERKLIAETGAAAPDHGDPQRMLGRQPFGLTNPLGRLDGARREAHGHAYGGHGFLCHGGTIETGGPQVNAASGGVPSRPAKLAGSSILASVPERLWRTCTWGGVATWHIGC